MLFGFISSLYFLILFFTVLLGLVLHCTFNLSIGGSDNILSALIVRSLLYKMIITFYSYSPISKLDTASDMWI